MAEQDREDLVPSVLNDLIDVDGEPADGDMLIRQGGVWVPAPPPLRDNGARVNMYRLTGTTTPNSGVTKINTVAPTDYSATWGAGGGLEAESFGSWVDSFGEYQWIPNEPGEYEIQTELYLTLSTATPNVATHVSLQPYTDPKYSFTNNRTVMGGAQGGSAIIFASALDELVAPQNAIDENQARYGFWWYWRAGAAETLVTWQAFIWVFQNSPGSPTNIYGDL